MIGSRLHSLADDAGDSWVSYDGCPCANARRSHKHFVKKRTSKENSADILEHTEGLHATKSGASLEDQAVTVLGILHRIAEDLETDNSIFGILPGLKLLEGDDRDKLTFYEEVEASGYLQTDEVYAIESVMNSAITAKAEKVLPVLGGAADIVKKLELLDETKFDNWIDEIKDAVSVIYKLDKTDDDIWNASKKLAELFEKESTRAFLRMLDSGLLAAIANTIESGQAPKIEVVENEEEDEMIPESNTFEQTFESEEVNGDDDSFEYERIMQMADIHASKLVNMHTFNPVWVENIDMNKYA